MSKEARIEEWLEWTDEVADGVEPALFWYMKGFNSDGELGSALSAGDRFSQAFQNWLNSSGVDGLHNRYPTFTEYASFIFLKRCKRKGVAPDAFVPEWALSSKPGSAI